MGYPIVELYDWLKKECWMGNSPLGHCVDSSMFIERIWGWEAWEGEYHAWNKSPEGLILDITVEQFGPCHATELVTPTTVFDPWMNVSYFSDCPKRLKGKNSTTEEWVRKYSNKGLKF